MVNMICQTIPDEYRLVKRDGEILLQGGFHCTDDKTGVGNVEWRDMPTLTETVKDQLEVSPTNDQIAQIMLLHGTGKQCKEALEYIGVQTPKNNELISNRGERYWFIGFDRNDYAIVERIQPLNPHGPTMSVWMLRDSDSDVELLTINNCDYELKHILKNILLPTLDERGEQTPKNPKKTVPPPPPPPKKS